MIMEEKYTCPRIAIVLLNFNNYLDTINCIKSLKCIRNKDFITIVVDNKSTNNSLEKLKVLENNKIIVVDSRKNGGFAYGNNIGIAIALKRQVDYVLLLNNDTLVTSDFLDKLLDCFSEKDNVGIATCRIMYNEDRKKVWYAGGQMDWNNLRAIHYNINEYEFKIQKIEEVDFASGCCMLISSKCLHEIGGLSEDYFMYCEDMDYCIKAQENGYRILYNPRAVIYHCVSSSGGGADSPFVIEWSNRSRRIIFKKYKNHIDKTKRLYVYIKCELYTLTKILLKSHRLDSLAAYKKSFKKT